MQAFRRAFQRQATVLKRRHIVGWRTALRHCRLFVVSCARSAVVATPAAVSVPSRWSTGTDKQTSVWAAAHSRPTCFAAPCQLLLLLRLLRTPGVGVDRTHTHIPRCERSQRSGWSNGNSGCHFTPTAVCDGCCYGLLHACRRLPAVPGSPQNRRLPLPLKHTYAQNYTRRGRFLGDEGLPKVLIVPDSSNSRLSHPAHLQRRASEVAGVEVRLRLEWRSTLEGGGGRRLSGGKALLGRAHPL